jgi:branched-chain amino acid transport system substrate-binding protein
MSFIRILLASALVVALAGAAAAGEIAVGYSLPLSGEHAQYGEVFRNSATMRFEEFNESGVLGTKVELIMEDSKSDPKEAMNIARKFLDNDAIIGVLGDFTSTVSMAAGQIYARGEMPQLSQTASHPDYTKISKWQFRNITSQAFEGPFVADWTTGLGYDSFAIVAIQNDWGISAAENFRDALIERGGEVVALEYFNPGARDYRSILTKINREKPEAIYICMMYEEGAMFMQQRKQLNIDIPVFGTSSLYSPKLLELAGDAAEGLLLSTTFMPTSPKPHVQAYVREYSERYDSEPNMFAAQAYDAAGIMLDAIARAGGADATRADVRDALAATTDFQGVTGDTSFDPETRGPVKSLARMKIEDGEFVLVQ